jgi:DNA adenine methylase
LARSQTGGSIPKPFVKWAGGKGKLVSRLLKLAPADFNAYHEPFLGGAALFFGLRRAGLLKNRTIFLSDVNPELVGVYISIRDQVDTVIRNLKKHRYDREYYYSIREQNPKMLTTAQRAARMIFLNRCGFNGLYRVNSKGGFNVPFGRHKNPTICDSKNLRAVSRALQEVNILCQSFENALSQSQEGDFVYFDPPYVPVSPTAKFVSYAKTGFDLGDQSRLVEVFSQLAHQGRYAMLSNSDVPWVVTHYKGFLQTQVQVNRSINANKDRRGSVGELIITTYERRGGHARQSQSR